MSAKISLTRISGGPATGAITGGKFIVCEPQKDERKMPLVRAFLRDHEVAQMVIAMPRLGFTRDYRKAAVADVCRALTAEGKAWVLDATPILNFRPTTQTTPHP